MYGSDVTVQEINQFIKHGKEDAGIEPKNVATND